MQLFLFNQSTFEVDVSPEITQIKPLNKLVTRDKSVLKLVAKAELAYIYFMADYKSDFQSIIDEDERSKEIITVLDNLPKGWKPDKAVQDAIIFYKERSKTIASVALEHQRKNVYTLITKIGDFINSDDIGEIQKATTISEKIKGLILSIDDLEKIVKGQQETESRHRGSQQKGMLEDEL